jgi:hypothetical protein
MRGYVQSLAIYPGRGLFRGVDCAQRLTVKVSLGGTAIQPATA